MAKKIIRWCDRKITIHHKIPKHLWWNLHYDNKQVISEFRHRILHILTDRDNKATMPIEHIEQNLSEIWEAYVIEFREAIREVIEDFWIEAYNPNCFKRWRQQ